MDHPMTYEEYLEYEGFAKWQDSAGVPDWWWGLVLLVLFGCFVYGLIDSFKERRRGSPYRQLIKEQRRRRP